jgi:predicted tellurium resistance membrane protein TerC
MDLLTNPETWIALLTLTVLEIVLGIDNVIFISILVQRLPDASRDRARVIGLGLAMGMRILLLLTISWIVGLTAPVFTVAGNEFSWRDLILIAGGLFLLWKATTEIGESLEGEPAHHADPTARTASSAASSSRSSCSTSSSRSTRSSPRSGWPTRSSSWSRPSSSRSG